jgi:hypothetical protein
MVEVLDIPWHADKKRILRKIRTKVKGCGFPGHWPFREPLGSKTLMWLRAKDLDKQHGMRVSVRRVLYNLEYKSLPLEPVHMVCANFAETEEEAERLRRYCTNPAHMRISGFWEEAFQFIDSQIEKGWLYPDDAEKWFGWKNEHNIKQPEVKDFRADIENYAF